MIEARLLTAYLNTTYRVFFPDESVDIRVGVWQPRLDELLDGKSWAFISAENPGSRLAADNAERHHRLVGRMAGFACYPAQGIPDEGGWPPEESLLVSGIDEEQAASIGLEFGQNAILCGSPGEPARLVLLSG